jgi:hypothetical protein
MSRRDRKTVAWISDHPPTIEQTEYMTERGYRVIQIRSPKPNRWKSAKEIWNQVCRLCSPTLIVMVLPSKGLGSSFLELCGNIPVYQAVMIKQGEQWVWCGKWERIEGTHYLKHVEDIPNA